MRIGMILDKEYPPDVRVKREAKALVSAGHEVILVARNRKDAAREEVVDGFRVCRLPALTFAGSRAARWMSLPVPVNPFYLRAMQHLVADEKVDVLHVHDLPLVMAAVAFGKLADLPVVFDLHEDYPAMVADYVRSPPARLLFRRFRTLHHLERLSLASVSHCLVVVEEQKQRLVDLGVPADRITVVPNVLDLGDLPPAPEDPPEDHDDVRFIYTGLFGAARGLDRVLEAMGRLPYDAPVRLVLVGDGDMRAKLESQAKRLGIADKIDFAGWQPRDRLGEYMVDADVGLVPHLVTPHIQTTMPNKIYEFLAYGLPLITSHARPLARLVDEAGCGEAVFIDDPDALAAAMKRMIDDPERRWALGDAGRSYVVKRHNWAVLGAPALLSAYESLAKR